MRHRWLALALVAALPACKSGAPAPTVSTNGLEVTTVTITGAKRHAFNAEIAKSTAEQAKGLMFRTDIPADSAMLFWPYPAEGGGPRVANFWMKDTPSPLDIIFIRADGTIARIAENAIPFSETPMSSGEPVAAVLEIAGGRSAELRIGEGDRVTWPGRR